MIAPFLCAPSVQSLAPLQLSPSVVLLCSGQFLAVLMLRNAVSRSSWIGRALAAGQQGAQGASHSCPCGEPYAVQDGVVYSHTHAHASSGYRSTLAAKPWGPGVVTASICSHASTPVSSSSGAAAQQIRLFSKHESERPADVSKAPPAEQQAHASNGAEQKGSAESSAEQAQDQERRSSSGQASTSGSSADGSSSNSASSSRDAWTGSQEFQRVEAEMKRVAGLNRLESAERMEAHNPLTWIRDGFRFLEVQPAGLRRLPKSCLHACMPQQPQARLFHIFEPRGIWRGRVR